LSYPRLAPTRSARSARKTAWQKVTLACLHLDEIKAFQSQISKRTKRAPADGAAIKDRAADGPATRKCRCQNQKKLAPQMCANVLRQDCRLRKTRMHMASAPAPAPLSARLATRTTLCLCPERSRFMDKSVSSSTMANPELRKRSHPSGAPTGHVAIGACCITVCDSQFASSSPSPLS